MVIIIAGVAGTGKTTVGKLLAQQLAIPFYDADDFHPPSNREKMKRGIPLRDEDRRPWLDLLAQKLEQWALKEGAVLACSALKEPYRQQLMRVPQLTWIFLNGSEKLIARRLKAREGHFFKAELLDSQFETLQIPDYGWHFDVSQPAELIVQEILNKLKGTH